MSDPPATTKYERSVKKCETCKLPTWYKNSAYGHCMHVSHIDPDFACNRWAPRAEEGITP